jgi:hypothetical protein
LVRRAQVRSKIAGSWPQRGDDVNRNPGIKEQGFMRAAEIMEL